MAYYRNPLILLPYLCFLIPLNICIFGNGTGIAIQWALFRYQQIPGADLGLVSFTQDISQCLSGTLSCASAPGTLIWFLAVCLLTGSFLLTLLGLPTRNRNYATWAAVVFLASGILFMVSDLVQYGMTLQAPSVSCIPVGIIVVLIAGWWACRYDPYPETFAGPSAKAPSDEPVRIFSVTLSGINRSILKKDLIILVLTSLVIKMLVLSSALSTLQVILSGDMTLYYWYAHSIVLGKIPYIDFNAEYPQLFFIPVVLALLPLLGNPDFTGFLFSFGAMTMVFDLATLVCVYILAAKFFSQERAFISGLLYVTALSTSFFIPIVYDIIPTFLLVFSLCCFVYGKEIVSYLSAAVGFMLKWFPFACFPVFYISTLKNKRDLSSFRTGVIATVLLVASCVVPFIVINSEMFFRTYLFHITRLPEGHSLIYYLDAISLVLVNLQPVSKVSLIVVILADCFLMYWYYRHLDGSALTLTYVLFLSVFIFVLFNKVMATYYLIWLTPFLALLLVRSRWHILLFYCIQIIMYLETPVLLGIVYTPYRYYSVIENSLPSVSFVFYTVKFAIFFVLLYAIVRDVRKIQNS
jgi:hypothetical protein